MWLPRTGLLGLGPLSPPGGQRSNANLLAKNLRLAVPGRRTIPPPENAGAGALIFLLSHGASFDTTLIQASFDPSGRRSVDQLAASVSTGRQPSRGTLPQLIPDGLPPDVHLKVALAIRHP